MSKAVIDLITDVLRDINVIDANEAPSAEQGMLALHKLNEMLADAQADGIRLGWYPIADADISADAPLADEDIRGVQFCLALELCPSFGMEPLQQLRENAADAYAKLAKRAIKYMESDTTFLPLAEGNSWGNYWPSMQ